MTTVLINDRVARAFDQRDAEIQHLYQRLRRLEEQLERLWRLRDQERQAP